MKCLKSPLLIAFIVFAALLPADAGQALKAHGIFSSHMVLQRDKPITVWGWAKPGGEVTVSFGPDDPQRVLLDGKWVDTEGGIASPDAGLNTAKITLKCDASGRWEAVFPKREASRNPLKITITGGEEKIEFHDILIGDVWVMNGQSNMAWSLGKSQQADLEVPQANLPMLRECRISPNEQSSLQTDLPASVLPGGGWVVATPETVGDFSAIGYAFAAEVMRTLQVPIGIITNARGGASLESLVPHHKFAEHPIAKRYADSVAERAAAYDPDELLVRMVKKWEEKNVQLRNKGVAENKLLPKPTKDDIRSWNIPGMSPSDAASCYNGMFGVFKGLGPKGVVFHQGYNNAMNGNCRPERYRVLMKLMVEGWREDFADPQLPVGVIGFCAGGIPQTDEDFEAWSNGGPPYIREAQRLGVSDLNDPEHTDFLPAYDIQIPGLHPAKKLDHGIRAARWALNKVYGLKVDWATAALVSAEPEGDEMVVTFDQPVMPDDMSMIPRGFSIASEDGKFYRAHARFRLTKDVGSWNTPNKSCDASIIHLWSPLVPKPVAVRYAWATSPMGNLKVQGKPWAPLASFRTDEWDFPESDDPALAVVSRAAGKAMTEDAATRLEFRKQEEAKMAIETLKRLERLGRD